MFDSAVQGWAAYIADGKYVALFLASVLGFWYMKMSGRKFTDAESKETDTLFLYATLSGVLVIFPLTAAVLMMYQTKFYDYEWIWTIVPFTAVIACAFTVLYLGYTRGKRRHNKVKSLLLAASIVCVIFLCGNLGGSISEDDPYMEVTGSIVDYLKEEDNEEGICLWAPSSLLQHVRELSGDIALLYGRNMWEEALNAYTYDIYEDDVAVLYEWMEEMDADWEMRMNQSGNEEILKSALDKGVNCIVVSHEASGSFELLLCEVTAGTVYEIKMEEVEGYCVFRLF